MTLHYVPFPRTYKTTSLFKHSVFSTKQPCVCGPSIPNQSIQSRCIGLLLTHRFTMFVVVHFVARRKKTLIYAAIVWLQFAVSGSTELKGIDKFRTFTIPNKDNFVILYPASSSKMLDTK